MLYFSLIPPSGSRIALPQDKQLEIAHAVIYCDHLQMWTDGVQYTHCGRFGCVSSEARICEIRRPKITFVNVLFTNKYDPHTLWRLLESGTKIMNIFWISKLFPKFIEWPFTQIAKIVSTDMGWLTNWKPRAEPQISQLDTDGTARTDDTDFS